MYRTFEAIYRDGQIIPLEEIEAEEKSKLLIVVLDLPFEKKIHIPGNL